MAKKQWNYTVTLYTDAGIEIDKINIAGTGDYATPDERLLIWDNNEVIFQTSLKYVVRKTSAKAAEES